MPITNETKHQRAIGVVLDQVAQRGIYLAVRTHKGSYRLDTAGQKKRIRVYSKFAEDWQTDDWRRDVADDTYNVVVLVDFVEPVPVLFLIPADVWRKELEEHGRDSGHQGIAKERVIRWLYRWDVME